MCGIAGFHSLDGREIDRAGQFANELLLSIVDRGRDATGLLAVGHDGTHHLQKQAKSAFGFVRGRALFPSPRTVLLHTRFATTGVRTSPRDAHPQVSGRAAAIHNGTIWNADELFETFRIPRLAKVDSEIIPAMVDMAGWTDAEKALALMKGGAATAVVHADHPGEVLLARLRSYPLAYAHVERFNLLVWASTPFAIREAWKFTYKSEIPAAIKMLDPGECVRAYDTLARTTIPGVYGVENDRAFGWKSSPQPRPKTASKQPASSSGGKVTKAGPKSKRQGKLERAARAKAMVAGTGTAAEVDRLLAQLDEIKKENARLKEEVTDLREELDVAEELLNGDWSVAALEEAS